MKNRFFFTRKGGRPERYKKTEGRQEERERQAVSRRMRMQKVRLVPPEAKRTAWRTLTTSPAQSPAATCFTFSSMTRCLIRALLVVVSALKGVLNRIALGRK